MGERYVHATKVRSRRQLRLISGAPPARPGPRPVGISRRSPTPGSPDRRLQGSCGPPSARPNPRLTGPASRASAQPPQHVGVIFSKYLTRARPRQADLVFHRSHISHTDAGGTRNLHHWMRLPFGTDHEGTPVRPGHAGSAHLYGRDRRTAPHSVIAPEKNSPPSPNTSTAFRHHLCPTETASRSGDQVSDRH